MLWRDDNLLNPPRYVVQLMVDNHEDKLAFLKLICRHVANTRCFPVCNILSTFST